jgi:hypothetical protein
MFMAVTTSEAGTSPVGPHHDCHDRADDGGGEQRMEADNPDRGPRRTFTSDWNFRWHGYLRGIRRKPVAPACLPAFFPPQSGPVIEAFPDLALDGPD